MYKFSQLHFEQTEPQMIIRLSDNASIPCDPANTDYQAYLAWVAEVNEAAEWNPEETE